MVKLYFILLWSLIVLCGGCAITEVLTGAGNFLALFMILVSLLLIGYIIKLPVTINKD